MESPPAAGNQAIIFTRCRMMTDYRPGVVPPAGGRRQSSRSHELPGDRKYDETRNDQGAATRPAGLIKSFFLMKVAGRTVHVPLGLDGTKYACTEMEKRKQLTFRQAMARHAGCIVELGYRQVDASYPDHEQLPVSKAPAIFVWSDRRAADSGDENRCLAVYWLRDID